MKAILSMKRHSYLKLIGTLLIAASLIAGMVGCSNRPAVDAIEIRDWYDLAAIGNNMSANYVLENDLDATTNGWEELASPTANGGKGWEPIAGIDRDPGFAYFSGVFDGQGHEIKDLFINRPDGYQVGLFAYSNLLGVIRNVGVVDANVTGGDRVGSLVGQVASAFVSNCHATGNVTGSGWWVGGLAGGIWTNSIVSNSYFTGSVSGYAGVGGLLGIVNEGTVTDSYSTGSVAGGSKVGGLVGSADNGTITGSYYTGNVTGHDLVGGLVGSSDDNTISSSYATGSVSGNETVGGLVGMNWGIVSLSYSTGSVTGNLHVGGLAGGNNYTVSDCYSRGRVIGGDQAGGLVGTHQGGIINNSYSTGNVTGDYSVGGLVGANVYESEANVVSTSFWDIETSGLPYSDGGTGKNTTEMQDIVTFHDAGWSIIGVGNSDQRNPAYTWNIVDMVTYPFLSW